MDQRLALTIANFFLILGDKAVIDCGDAIFGPLENKLTGDMNLSNETQHTDTMADTI